MPKRRGGKNSEQARKGTAEPDAEHSGSEDEPLGEPPLVTPYTRLLEAEAQTALEAAKPRLLPKNDLDRVMLSRAAMHEHQILLQCAQCKSTHSHGRYCLRRALCPAALQELRVHNHGACGTRQVALLGDRF